MLVKLAAIFFSMILVNNYVLVKFYGICPFLGVSKKLDSFRWYVRRCYLRHVHGYGRDLPHPDLRSGSG